MKILAILQNQWFKDPEKVKQIYARNPEHRNELIKRFLFMGCLSGRRLQQAFGDLCNTIIWEEASSEIGGFSASAFPADVEHIKNAIYQHNPDVLIAFGKIASDGAFKALTGLGFPDGKRDIRFVTAPHPAARKDPMPRLREIASLLA